MVRVYLCDAFGWAPYFFTCNFLLVLTRHEHTCYCSAIILGRFKTTIITVVLVSADTREDAMYTPCEDRAGARGGGGLLQHTHALRMTALCTAC